MRRGRCILDRVGWKVEIPSTEVKVSGKFACGSSTTVGKACATDTRSGEVIARRNDFDQSVFYIATKKNEHNAPAIVSYLVRPMRKR